MRLSIGTDIAVPADRVWEELINIRAWPRWGPTVRAAQLTTGDVRIGPDASGRVQTAAGIWLPFRIDDWRDEDGVRAWSWRVAGVHATSHSVTTDGPHRCRLEMGVPWWAPAYLGVVAIALSRIRRLVERAEPEG